MYVNIMVSVDVRLGYDNPHTVSIMAMDEVAKLIQHCHGWYC